MFDGGCVCVLDGWYAWVTGVSPFTRCEGEVEGGDGFITQHLHNKNKNLHVILSLLANFTFYLLQVLFSIRCSTKSFDRVVS